MCAIIWEISKLAIGLNEKLVLTSNLKPNYSKHGTRKLIKLSRLLLYVGKLWPYDYDGFLDVILVLGVVGELNSSSRSIARGHSSRNGRSLGRASHRTPSLVYLEDLI